MKIDNLLGCLGLEFYCDFRLAVLGCVSNVLGFGFAGDILHKLELECRWKHLVQWLYRRCYQSLGDWALLGRSSLSSNCHNAVLFIF